MMAKRHNPESLRTDLRVLLVEDEPMLRELAADSLTDAGYHVTEAADGVDGLAILQSDALFDLMLSDIRLPGPDGYHLAEKGRALRPTMTVMLMTGYAPTPLPPHLHGVVHSVLEKPFDVDTLPDTIAAALGGKTPDAP